MTKKLEAAIKSIEKELKSLMVKLDRITKKAAKSKPAKKTVAKKAPAKKAAKGVTAYDQVIGIIKKNKKGVDNATLIKNTGFDAKKVANIIFKAKKRGAIKAVKKGVYVKA